MAVKDLHQSRDKDFMKADNENTFFRKASDRDLMNGNYSFSDKGNTLPPSPDKLLKLYYESEMPEGFSKRGKDLDHCVEVPVFRSTSCTFGGWRSNEPIGESLYIPETDEPFSLQENYDELVASDIQLMVQPYVADTDLLREAVGKEDDFDISLPLKETTDRNSQLGDIRSVGVTRINGQYTCTIDGLRASIDHKYIGGWEPLKEYMLDVSFDDPGASAGRSGLIGRVWTDDANGKKQVHRNVSIPVEWDEPDAPDYEPDFF